MDIKKTVSEITTRPMDRREFLASTGAVALTVLGVSAVLRSLGSNRGQGGQSSSNGYGASAYGGDKSGR